MPIYSQYTCNSCNETKPTDFFYKSNRTNGFRQPCKQCSNAKYNATKTTLCPVAVDLPNEQWKVYPLDDAYAVSNLGRVKRLTNGQGTWAERLLTPHLDKDGYAIARLGSKSTKIHRMVCITFHGQPADPKAQVNHKDGIKTNNVVENIEWCTAQENMTHAKQNGLRPVGEATPHSKLQAQDIPVIRQLLDKGLTCTEISKRYSVSNTTIWSIKHRMSWTHIT